MAFSPEKEMAWQLIRKASEMFCSFVTATFSVFVLVLAITTFSSSTSTSTNSPTAPPSAQERSRCDTDELRGYIIAYERYLACCQTIALLLIYFVRTIVESLHESYEQAAEENREKFKEAMFELNVAKEKLYTAREKHIQCAASACRSPNDEACMMALNVALDDESRLDVDVEKAKMQAYTLRPKEGMQRSPGKWRIVVRTCFFFSVLSSQVGSVLAGLAFYHSLEIQLDYKPGGFLATAAFSLVAFCSLAFHGFFGWISVSQI